MGCGPDLDEAPAVGSTAQAVETMPDPGHQLTESKRLTNEQIFGTNVQADLNRPVFQDRYGYAAPALNPSH
jgi:hypothetical protein